MTKEENFLLLQDLFGRLLYGVMVLDDMGRTYELQIGNSYLIDLFYNNGDYVEAPIKPYLRPMSSMTDEEREEWTMPQIEMEIEALSEPTFEDDEFRSNINANSYCVDWLLKKHFDYRGLIEKGLAIAVTENNYPYNK